MKKFIFIAVLLAICTGVGAQENLYEIKSGKVTMQMDMMGRKITQEIYFDDYGQKQATVMDMRGKTMRSITVDGENIMIDDKEMTAVKMPAFDMGGEKINFNDKSEKNIRRNKIKVIGTEEIAGKECTKYTAAIFLMGQVVKQTAWIYKGVTMKTSVKTDFGEMGMTAVSIEEDIEIPASMFTIPEGVTVQEMDRSRMPQFPNEQDRERLFLNTN